MLTLNQIKYKLILFFVSHAQINDVKYESDFAFNAERNLIYPICNLEFTDASISNRTLNYNFKVVLGDIITEEYQQDEIISDMLLVAEDLYSYLQNAEGWIFSKSSSIQKFLDDTSDKASGIVFRITLSVIRSQNECITPVNEVVSNNQYSDSDYSPVDYA